MEGFLNIILSGIIGIIMIFQIYYYNKRRIIIITLVDDTFSHLQTTVINIGKRNIYIDQVSIGYGNSKYRQQIVLKKKPKFNILKDDGEPYIETFTRNEIIESRKERMIKHHYWQLMWINVDISTGKRFSKPISIDSKIIEKSYKKADESYIAADTFIGFPQIPRSMDPVINK